MYIRHFSENESLAVSSQHLALEKIVVEGGENPAPAASSLVQMAHEFRKSLARFLSLNPPRS